MNSPYHSGELAVQKQAGVEKEAAGLSRMVTDRIVRGIGYFLEKQPFVIISYKNSSGDIQVQLLSGTDYFVELPDETTIEIDKSLLHDSPDKSLINGLPAGTSMGMLFIELPTRKRFRVNGSVRKNDLKLVIDVQQAYGNCPKYIQKRTLDQVITERKTVTTDGESLTTKMIELISGIDTLFIGSESADGMHDVSHRGGNPGFIQVQDSQTLRIPDYPGNNMFNTLGNIHQNPLTGMLLTDFQTGTAIRLSGKAEIQFDRHQDQDHARSGETGRFLLLRITSVSFMENYLPYHTSLQEYSPFNP